jgi:hypothetical protein
MRLSAGKSSDDRNKIIAMAAFVVVAGGILYYELFSTPTPPAPPTAAAPSNSAPAAPAGPAARPIATTSAALDPTLHMAAMTLAESVLYSGAGRNIFSPASAPPPVAIPKPIAQARINQPPPMPAAPQPPPGPPPPPPIDLKFFGTATAADGTRQAFLLHNDDVFLASTGDIVMRRYKVVSIEARTIHVEDMQYNNTQTLPLLTD